MIAGRRRDWGCWTCRIRRLKCDEKRDSCERCQACNIPCFGYGPKPDWKDGGKREADKLAAIKAGVAANRRHRTLNAKTKSRQSNRRTQAVSIGSEKEGAMHAETSPRVIRIASTPVESPAQSSSGHCMSDEANKSDEANITETVPASLIQMAARATTIEQCNIDYWLDRWEESVEWTAESADLGKALSQKQVLLDLTEDRKTVLFQHYLDHIFSLQYFHQQYLQPETLPQEWFFSLLQSISPLQHAVLSISALHMRCLQSGNDGQNAANEVAQDEDYSVLLEEYRAEALKGLRLFIRDYELVSATNGYIRILACCSQFISFDLFEGGTGQWYSHLEAATNLIIQRVGSDSRIPAADELHVRHVETFLVGALVWSDILAPASTGRRSRLHTLFPRLIGPPQSQYLPINLENIMGCENEVMLLISDISVLQEWKQDSLATRTYSIWELVSRSNIIRDDLEATILRLERRLQGYWPHTTNEMTSYNKNMLTAIMTYIFACAAAVYLQVVVCGIQPALPEISQTVERTIQAMQRLPEGERGRLSRSVLWPTCIAGSVAETHHQTFFREFIQIAVNDSKGFGNAETALEIMEASWETLNEQQLYSPASQCSSGFVSLVTNKGLTSMKPH